MALQYKARQGHRVISNIFLVGSSEWKIPDLMEYRDGCHHYKLELQCI